MSFWRKSIGALGIAVLGGLVQGEAAEPGAEVNPAITKVTARARGFVLMEPREVGSPEERVILHLEPGPGPLPFNQSFIKQRTDVARLGPRPDVPTFMFVGRCPFHRTTIRTWWDIWWGWIPRCGHTIIRRDSRFCPTATC